MAWDITKLRLAILAPVAWRTPPRGYGPWEQVASLIAEGMVARGAQVTLFATKDSQTAGKLHAVAPAGYEEDKTVDRKVWEIMHISEVFEHADEFDVIHNNFDFLPLAFSRLIKTPIITTIHGFSSRAILPVYQKYNNHVHYVSISDADRDPTLTYVSTVYHGLDLRDFMFQQQAGEYLLFFGRIHKDKGTKEAIEIAQRTGHRLIIAGIIQDPHYYEKEVQPHVDGDQIQYVGVADPRHRNQLLGNALALLHPINFNEPFGLSVIESMACGTPVIAMNRGSMPELIVNDKNGYLVRSVDEAIVAVKKISSIDRAVCRQHIENYFTVDKMLDGYEAVYGKVVAGT